MDATLLDDIFAKQEERKTNDTLLKIESFNNNVLMIALN